MGYSNPPINVLTYCGHEFVDMMQDYRHLIEADAALFRKQIVE